MTTIAYGNGVLASDSRSCIGDMIYEEDAQKIFQNIGPFDVIAIAGDYQAAVDTLELISTYTTLDQIRVIPSSEIGEVSILGLTVDKRLWSYAGDKSCELRADRPFAVGSGAPYALAALDLGLEPEEAVAYAATRDAMTNNTIQTTRDDTVTPEVTPEVTSEITKH